MNSRVAADVGWAVLLGALAAASPHTSGGRLVPSLAGGLLVAAATFAWRRGALSGLFPRRYPPGQAPATGVSLAPLAWLCIGAWLLVQLPTIEWLAKQYTISIWRNGHGLFLGPLVYVLARDRLRANPVTDRTGSLWGLPLLALALWLALVEAGTGLGYPGAIGLIVSVPALSLLLLGAEATRRIAFPLALLVFLLPTPEGPVDPFSLASATAVVAMPFLDAVGLEPIRQESLIVLEGIRFSVSANCSGLSTFYSGILIALVLGARTDSWRTRIALLLAVWPVTLFFNSIRLFFILGGTAVWGVPWAHSPLHTISGLATFWVVLVALAGLAWLAARRTGAEATP